MTCAWCNKDSSEDGGQGQSRGSKIEVKDHFGRVLLFIIMQSRDDSRSMIFDGWMMLLCFLCMPPHSLPLLPFSSALINTLFMQSP
jgi:hypothetical protein